MWPSEPVAPLPESSRPKFGRGPSHKFRSSAGAVQRGAPSLHTLSSTSSNGKLLRLTQSHIVSEWHTLQLNSTRYWQAVISGRVCHARAGPTTLHPPRRRAATGGNRPRTGCFTALYFNNSRHFLILQPVISVKFVPLIISSHIKMFDTKFQPWIMTHGSLVRSDQ